jgi:hypothetical protein
MQAAASSHRRINRGNLFHDYPKDLRGSKKCLARNLGGDFEGSGRPCRGYFELPDVGQQGKGFRWTAVSTCARSPYNSAVVFTSSRFAIPVGTTGPLSDIVVGEKQTEICFEASPQSRFFLYQCTAIRLIFYSADSQVIERA